MTKTQKRLAIVIGALGAAALLFVLVLPGLLRSLGLHPSFEGQRYLLAEGLRTVTRPGSSDPS